MPQSASRQVALCVGDYNSHAGFHSSERRHVCEQMKATGIHWAVLMQLASRGGLSGHPIIGPERVGGYIQAIRGRNSNCVDGADTQSQFANPRHHCNSESLSPLANGLETVDECGEIHVFVGEQSAGGIPSGIFAGASSTSGISMQLKDLGMREYQERWRERWREYIVRLPTKELVQISFRL